MRYPWIDVAKGIGIILVVYGHVLRGLIKSGIAGGDFYNYIDSIIYTFHMPLFMLLSGVFVISSIDKHGSKRFFFTKLDVIFYPYFIWMILQGCLEVLLSEYTNGNASLVEVFSIWLPRAQFWYLHTLFIFLSVFLVFYYILKKWAFILLPFGLFIYLYFSEYEMGVLSSINRFLFFFMLGVFFGVFMPELERFVRNFYFGIIFFVLAVASQYYYHFVLGLSYSSYGALTLVVSLVSLMSVLFLSYNIERFGVGSLLGLIGQASILIYLGHILTASGARIVASKILGLEMVYLQVIIGMFFGVVFLAFL